MKIFLSAAVAALLGSASFAANRVTNDPNDPQPEDSSSDYTYYEESQLLSGFTKLYEDDEVSASWGGRIMVDAIWDDTDSDYPGGGSGDGVEFRRSRFFAKVKFYGTVEAKAQYDFASATANFADVYMRFPSPIGKLTVGHHKQPMSLEELTSSRFITFMERASVVEAFAPSRDTGISTGGLIGDSTGWAIGFFRRTNDQGNSQLAGGDGVGTGRVYHAFGGGTNLVHVGASVSQWASQQVLFRARPENHFVATRPLSTGLMNADGVMIYGLEGAWVNGPLSVQGEFMHNSIDDFGGGGDVDLDGFYAYVSYFLTGESRNYKGGKFDRVTPSSNWEGSGFSGGAWEVALRYSMLDFGEVAGQGEMQNITVGANWYLNPHSRVMLNYVTSNVDDSAAIDADHDAIMMRWQVDW